MDSELKVTRQGAMLYLADGLRTLLDNGMDSQDLLNYCSEVVIEHSKGIDVHMHEKLPGGKVN